RAEAPCRRAQLLEQVEVEEHRRDAEPLELLCRRDVRTRPVEDDEIRPPGGYGLDARRYSVADAGHGERLGRIVTPSRAAHEPVARADRKEDLRERRQVGRTETVSWLRAGGSPSRVMRPGGVWAATPCTSQWRGRAGLSPASVNPRSLVTTGLVYRIDVRDAMGGRSR